MNKWTQKSSHRGKTGRSDRVMVLSSKDLLWSDTKRQYTSAVLRVKGDGKSYQFRVESTPGLKHNYVYEFATSGEWEIIEIPLSGMYAEHHGNRLDLPNYPGKILSHVRFLIANGQAETFELLIDRIELK